MVGPHLLAMFFINWPKNKPFLVNFFKVFKLIFLDSHILDFFKLPYIF
jgi:hypothetical protein